MLHLHHLKQSRSFRILWLLEELALEYQLTTYERKNGLAPKRLKEIHPLGKAPILQDNENTLVESAVIIDYLIDHYDNEGTLAHSELIASTVIGKKLRPDYGTPEFEQYRYWLHFSESSLMPLLVMQLVLSTMVKKSPLPIKPISKLLKKGIDNSYLNDSLQGELAWIDKHLAKHDWFAGENFSGADIQMAYGLDNLQQAGSLNHYANIENWVKKCRLRPAFQKARQVA